LLGKLFFSWILVFMLSFILCTWSGCCGGSDSGSSDTGSIDNNSDTVSGGKTGVYSQNGGTATESSKTYAATGTDQSSVYVYGAGMYTLTDSTLTKTGATSSADDSNFLGNNAIALAEAASTINLSNVTLTSDSEGSNGAFAYKKGSIINLHGCKITTTGDSSRGVDATYGGTINIYDSEITTSGAHCSALATDRYDTANGEPKVNAYRVTATVSGNGSVGVYSTGEFYVEGCDLTSNGSGTAVIEGTNSITLVDTDLKTTMADKYGVMIYQSMSGDALGNTGTFEMTGGSLTVNGGPFLLNTNDEGYFTLKDNVGLTGSEIILKSCKCDWGATATNGGVTHFTADNQNLAGDFVVDNYGSITAAIQNSSILTGAINPDNAAGAVSITMDSTSKWTATANSYVDTLNGIVLSGATPQNVDAAAGVVIYYGSGTGLTGDYTLTSGGMLKAN
jgi:hypothetical protein